MLTLLLLQHVRPNKTISERGQIFNVLCLWQAIENEKLYFRYHADKLAQTVQGQADR